MPDLPFPPSILMQAIRVGSRVIEPSRETRLLRAALAISEVMDLSVNGGVLHSELGDGNYEGDLTRAWSYVLAEHAAGRCSPEEFRRAQEALETLGALSDIERDAAYWLWLRARRWAGWDLP